MHNTLRYYARRLSGFFYLFLLVETLTRLTLLIKEGANIDFAFQPLLQSFLHGFVFDLSVFLYFASFFSFYLLALNKPLHQSPLDRNIMLGWRIIFAFVLLFTALSEWFFWDEFHARFNFIAVDYLVYTHEVIGNIRESYPVVPLITAVAILAGGIAWVLGRMAHVTNATVPNLARRALASFALILCSFGGFLALNDAQSEISDNHLLNEVTKNGFYELFAAFRHNELSYDRFFTTLPQAEAESALAEKLGGDPRHARPIVTDGTETHENVVLITIESMSARFMQSFGNKQGLTPNLDRLAKESLFFTNLYATGTRTVYGLSSVSLGLPPLAGNAVVRRPDNGGLFTLGSLLRSKGYESKFLYGGYGMFDNMNPYFSANGYDIVDRGEMSEEEISFANVWGVSDEDLFRRTLRENDETFAAGKPFFDHVMTTSNHRPYTYPANRIDIPSHSGREGAVKYTDYAIGYFLEEAKKHPWFNHTIFVITADHTAGSAGKSELDPAGYHIPMMIYAPGRIAPRVVDGMTSQIDIPPTILGLMNMQYDTKFWGIDALRQTPNRAFISNYQQLGYLTPESLVVLKPVKRVDEYLRKGDQFIHQEKPDAKLLREAIGYYQNANQWRSWNQQDGAISSSANPAATKPESLSPWALPKLFAYFVIGAGFFFLLCHALHARRKKLGKNSLTLQWQWWHALSCNHRIASVLAVLLVLGSGYQFGLRLNGNFHEVVDGEVYRSAQMDAGKLADYAKEYHLRSVLTLRAADPSDPKYQAEKTEAAKLGIQLISFPIRSNHELSIPEAIKLIATMKDAPKPLLIHGEDANTQAGLASAIYIAAIQKGGEFWAELQLSPLYGHFPLWFRRDYAMDRTFEALEPMFGYEGS